MQDYVVIQVGDKTHAVESAHLPPVGTRIVAHKHLHDGGTYPTLEVVDYEWRLEEPAEENGLPFFRIAIKTRMVN